MPCCGRWRFRQLVKHIILPGLLVFGVNIMWITTRFAGPLLPDQRWINIIQQAVQGIVSSGIIALGIKVASGLKWSHARRHKGTTLRGLLEVPETSFGKVFKSMRRAGSCLEAFLYVFVLGASMLHFLLNVAKEPDVLVPGWPFYTSGYAMVPDSSTTQLLPIDFQAADSLTQPRNRDAFINAHIRENVRDPEERSEWMYSPALLASGNFSFTGAAKQDPDSPVVLEVAQPAVLLFRQNLAAKLNNTFNSDSLWDSPLDSLSADGNYRIQYGQYTFTIDDTNVGAQAGICLTHLPTYNTNPDGAYTCVTMGYVMVNAHVAYDVNGRIVDSYIYSISFDYPPIDINEVDASDFAPYFEEFTEGWDLWTGYSLLSGSLWSLLSNFSVEASKAEATEGLYAPATPEPLIGVALYTGLASVTVLILCALLLCFDPEEATQSTGLLALSRWPAELTAGTYGASEKLEQSGKRRVYLEQHPSGQWTFAPKKGGLLPSPPILSPSSSSDTNTNKVQPMMDFLPDLLSSEIMSKRRQTYQPSTPSSPITPEFQAPRPHSYQSQPSYQSRPSYKSRLSSTSGSTPVNDMPSSPPVFSPGFRASPSMSPGQVQPDFPSPGVESPLLDTSSPPFLVGVEQMPPFPGSRPAYPTY